MVVGRLARTLSRLSLGLVLVVGWGWMYLNVEDIFPVNTVAMRGILTTYLLFTALIFSFDTIAGVKGERAIFQISFLKGFWKFILFAGIGLGILFLFGLALKGDALPTIRTAILGIGFGMILLHAFFISIFEQLVFFGRFPAEMRARGINESAIWIISALIFAGFHWALGGSIWSLAVYVPLGIIFMAVGNKWSPRTRMADAGLHFSYNLFVLGFLSTI